MRPATLRLLLLAVVSAAILGGQATPAAAATPNGCGQLTSNCGVTGEASHFHGVLAVTGEPWVLDASATGGTTAGCGDCSWSMVPACVIEHQGSPDTLCDGATAAPICDPGQVLYRLYLTTAAFTDRDEGVLCIGGSNQPVPVSDIAIVDIRRYLDNVRPPALAISTRPRRSTLAGLPTYFTAMAPSGLQPTTFGGPEVTEHITIVPAQIRWHWGDGTAGDWLKPSDQTTHSFVSGGVAHGSLDGRWSASYTVSYAGHTFGPYDANRDVTRQQQFRLPVHTSTPVLIAGR